MTSNNVCFCKFRFVSKIVHPTNKNDSVAWKHQQFESDTEHITQMLKDFCLPALQLTIFVQWLREKRPEEDLELHQITFVLFPA